MCTKNIIFPSQNNEVTLSEHPFDCIAGISLSSLGLEHGTTKNTRDRLFHVFTGSYSVDRPVCKICGRPMDYNGQRPVKLHHLPHENQASLVRIYRDEFYCPHCKCYHIPPLPCQFLNLKVTIDLALAIYEKTQHLRTDRDHARELGISEYLAMKVLDAWQALKFRTPLSDVLDDECHWQIFGYYTQLSVDEFATKGRDYVSVFTGITEDFNSVLFYAKGRGMDTVEEFVQKAKGHIAKDAVIASDMHAPYSIGFKKYLPESIPSLDKSHVFHHLNDWVRDSVQDFLAIQTKDELLKKQLKDPKLVGMLTQKKQLDGEQQKIIDEIGAKEPDVLKLRKLVELVHQAYDSRNRAVMEQLMTQAMFLCDELQNEDRVSSKYKKSRMLASFVELVEQGSTADDAASASVSSANSNSDPKPDYSSITTRPAAPNPPKPTHKKPYYVARFGQMIISHWKGVINYAETGLTSNVSEGYNNLIKEMKHEKFGIKKLGRFMGRFCLCASWIYQRHVTAGFRHICLDATVLNNAARVLFS